MEQIIEGAPGGTGGQVVIKDTTTANFKADVIDASMKPQSRRLLGAVVRALQATNTDP